MWRLNLCTSSIVVSETCLELGVLGVGASDYNVAIHSQKTVNLMIGIEKPLSHMLLDASKLSNDE